MFRVMRKNHLNGKPWRPILPDRPIQLNKALARPKSNLLLIFRVVLFYFTGVDETKISHFNPSAMEKHAQRQTKLKGQKKATSITKHRLIKLSLLYLICFVTFAYNILINIL